MAKCWQLLTWDIPLKLMQRHRDDKAKAVVLEAKKDYVKPASRISCPKCGGEIEPYKHFKYDPAVSSLIRLCENWKSDGVFNMDLKCTSDQCDWRGQGGCVLVEVRG